MPSVSSIVGELVAADPTLSVGLHHGILNLTQVATFLQPRARARLRKDVSVPSILMALSRLRRAQADRDAVTAEPAASIVDRITVHAGLAVLSLARTPDAQRAVQRLFNKIQVEESYLTISEGVREIAIILEESNVRSFQSLLTEKPLKVVRNVAGLSVHIAEAAIDQPRVLYDVLQQVALQGISVVEITSTRSEFHLYLSDADVMLAFDSIYSKFANRIASAAMPASGTFSVTSRAMV